MCMTPSAPYDKSKSLDSGGGSPSNGYDWLTHWCQVNAQIPCELQNSVNQSTIERSCALGALLRACLCQRSHILTLLFQSGNMLTAQ